MNSVLLTGRLTRDPEVHTTETTSVCRFSLAVRRRGVPKEGQPDVDFISCVAFGKTAEFVGQYFIKGQKADLRGHIQTGSYTNQDGNKVYTTDVICDEIEFGESKTAAAGATTTATAQPTQTAKPTYTQQTRKTQADIANDWLSPDDGPFPFN